MEHKEILQCLPHRYPFLLVDRILELEDGRKVVGIKNVTANEPFFQGHFPGYPVMPGVLIIEAMAQVGGVAVLKMLEAPGKIVFLAGVDKARFRRQVLPGDQLRIEVEIFKQKGSVGKSKASAYVENKLVAEAELMYVLEKESD
ncbi:MAG: 3-hydroxyacyl-[acyl-carrier-protein] dehydratase FabZ [Peptococcaceae bacterium]|jgi:3-hydroxyacyl-[acyl-carrier-protein] dehydratase|nr:MAG: 3-hydroxyacyl-[acyl-carrier-protein] dehydratase FabZ [Peptococcaceae bacterium]